MADNFNTLDQATTTSAGIVDGTIVDADVSGSAAIAQSKIADLTTDLAAKTAKSTLTTKGDIYAATAASTPARLGVGTDGQVLQADSSQSTGLKWGSQLPSRPTTAGRYILLSGRPFISGTGTSTHVKDTWRYVPCKLATALSVDQLAVNTTTAATGGTAALIFGLFALDANNLPGTRQADWSSYGSIDLTAVAGVLTLTTAALTIPAGEWYIGYAWTGTATGAPVLTSISGIHPLVVGTAASITSSAYFESVSGASVPATASPATTTTSGGAVWARLA